MMYLKIFLYLRILQVNYTSIKLILFLKKKKEFSEVVSVLHDAVVGESVVQ